MDIPLFPLPNLVLFPQIRLPLHIFEDRYKLMIQRSIDNDEPFGIVQLRSGADRESPETIHRVGVTARITHVEHLEDGRMDVVCLGESRFRVAKFIGSLPYWTASVELFEDVDEGGDQLKTAHAEVVTLYHKAYEIGAKMRSTESTDLTLPESPIALSFMVSYVLDLDSAERQRLLEIVSTVERLEILVSHLRIAVRQLEIQLAQTEARSKVSGNGHLGSH